MQKPNKHPELDAPTPTPNLSWLPLHISLPYFCSSRMWCFYVHPSTVYLQFSSPMGLFKGESHHLTFQFESLHWFPSYSEWIPCASYWLNHLLLPQSSASLFNLPSLLPSVLPDMILEALWPTFLPSAIFWNSCFYSGSLMNWTFIWPNFLRISKGLTSTCCPVLS